MDVSSLVNGLHVHEERHSQRKLGNLYHHPRGLVRKASIVDVVKLGQHCRVGGVDLRTSN